MLVLRIWKIYELRRCDRVECHDIYTTFHKDLFRNCEVNRGIHIQTHRHSHTEDCDFTSLLVFFNIRKFCMSVCIGLKCGLPV
jgi:hypothetical protein